MAEALAAAVAKLERAGCDSPRLDAELLLAEALGATREQLITRSAEPLDDPARFDELIVRRVAREPVAYILGRKGFRRITVAVDRRVLIPRPETELLVEVGLGLPAQARVADVGTGSGAVALALKDERPDLSVVGIDIDGDALAVARANRETLGLDVEFVQADLLDGGGIYDAVLANLPYVADGAVVAPEVALYEPATALFAGADGLDLIRRLLARVADVSLVAVEVGFDQADAVSTMLNNAGFATVERLRDLAGHERVIVGRR